MRIRLKMGLLLGDRWYEEGEEADVEEKRGLELIKLNHASLLRELPEVQVATMNPSRVETAAKRGPGRPRKDSPL